MPGTTWFNAHHRALSAHLDTPPTPPDQAGDIFDGAGFHDHEVPERSEADHKHVRDIDWPEGSLLVSIRRDRDMIVPDGDTVLCPGDVITILVSSPALDRLVAELLEGDFDGGPGS